MLETNSRIYRPALMALLLLSAGMSACRDETSTTQAALAIAPPGQAVPAQKYGQVGDPIHLTVGYQPYYSEAWSGVVVNGLGLWKKYLPPGSTVEFQIGLQGSIIVNAMLADKQQIGYLGDTPAIVGATKREVSDLRIVAHIGLSQDQCNVFFARNDAPKFNSPDEAIQWLDKRTVAVPKGSCTDRFARAVFAKRKVEPAAYLNQNIELITSGFRAGKLDAAVVWEPIASRLVSEGLARRIASGHDVEENDGAFIEMRADLIKQRPDIVKAWLQAELDAELFIADGNNAREVARLAKEQTTGFDEQVLWHAIYGNKSASGEPSTRLTLPFGFTEASFELVKRATAFLHEVKSIDVPVLPPDALVAHFTDDILRERGLTKPVAEVRAEAEARAPH